MATSAAAAAPVKSVAVLPLKAKNKASQEVSSVLDDLVLAAVQRHASGLRVIGQSDIDAVLGFEKTKELIGCDGLSCAAEIAGALGVDSIIYGNFSRLGKKYVLTLAWLDQRNTTSLGRVSESIGDTEENFDTAVRTVVAKLFGKPPPAGAAAASPAPAPKPLTLDPNDLASWEPVTGTWYAKDGAIYGMGGHLVFREVLGDYVFSATAELVSGQHSAVAWISRFSHPQSTVSKPAGNADQGYGVNVWAGESKLNVFRGVNNTWYLANPAWQTWYPHASLRPKLNRCTWESIGPQHKVSCNGQLVHEFLDGTHPRGAVGFWVESGQTLVRFTDIEIERR